MGRRTGAVGVAAAMWGVGGVALLLLFAVVRLGRRGMETIHAGLGPWEWAALALLTAVFVYGEGCRAFQRRWVPRLVRRASALRHQGRTHHRVLAPLYGMSLIGGPPASTARAWAGTLAIVGAVMLVRILPEPWRGITDLAVASALAWGLGAMVAEARRALR